MRAAGERGHGGNVRVGSVWRLSAVAVQFTNFGLIGAFGLVVDVVVLWMMLSVVGADFYWGRFASYLAAATFTWYGNRTLTFRDRRSVRRAAEWRRFLMANAPGGVVNYGVYAFLVSQIPLFGNQPTLAVAVGSLAGLLFNFVASRLAVFTNRN
jgi:putative flippase GtrA